MNNLQVKARTASVFTSIVTISTAVSQGAAEIVKLVGDWDGQWVNLLALIPAVVVIIRNVTPAEYKGLL